MADTAGKAGWAVWAVWADRAGKATRCDMNNTGRSFQSIHHHQ